MKMKKFPGRMTRKEAKRYFEQGRAFIIVPSKCKPFYYGGIGAKMQYRLTEYASICYPQRLQEDEISFDIYVSEFMYYNCNYQVGYYPAFYEPNKELLDEYV